MEFQDIIGLLKGQSIPMTYKVGDKTPSKGLPFDIKLSIDQDFKKTILKAVGIFSLGVGAGIAVGIITNKKK